jgi:hypothetical protein
MTEAEFDFLAASLVQVGKSELTLLLEKEGKAIGFALCLPDINQSLIYNKSGSLLGAGFHLFTKRKLVDLVRIIVLGVIPEFRNAGADVLLYHRIGEAANKLGYRYGDAS